MMNEKTETIVPYVNFRVRELGEWTDKNTDDYFKDKRVIVFSLPGAFTPTCSLQQLPGFEKQASVFKEHGIDEIYCMSVNDSFVMNAWAKSQNISNVKVIPDGSGHFTKGVGMLVDKDNLGFGARSWRYAMIVDNMVVRNLFVEDGICDNAETDPYKETKPENILSELLSNAG